MTMNAYYIPAHSLVVGTSDPDIIALLFATYMGYANMSQAPGRYDGASLFGERMRVTTGCNGAGTGTTTTFLLGASNHDII